MSPPGTPKLSQSDCSTVQSFNRIPTETEWHRFRKYARGMQALKVDASRDLMTSEVLSVLQLRTGNDLLLPRLGSFECGSATEAFIPFIPLLLSGRTTCIDITFAESPPTVIVASTIARFPRLCPNIQRLTLCRLPTNPVVTEAVSEMVLACNQDTLQVFYVDSPLTEEGRSVLYKLPKLRILVAVLRGPTSLPPVALPNLKILRIDYDYRSEWLGLFRGTTFRKLESIIFVPTGSAQIGGFLEKFQSVAPSVQSTLSNFCFYTSQSWRPSYPAMLAFRQLKTLRIDFSCHHGCSSQVDDGIIISLAQAMPLLENLRLGQAPCSNPTGVGLRGLVALAHHCPRLAGLCVHLHVGELAEATTRTNPPSSPENTVDLPPMDCPLTELQVGSAPVPPQAAWTIALTLVQIFPQIRDIEYINPEWMGVVESITFFKKIGGHIHHTSKIPLHLIPIYSRC